MHRFTVQMCRHRPPSPIGCARLRFRLQRTGRMAASPKGVTLMPVVMTSSQKAEAPPGRTVAAVARRLGVSPSTLRSWDRRYGMGPSDHADGAHRRYSPLDVARLLHMQSLVRVGSPLRRRLPSRATGSRRLRVIRRPCWRRAAAPARSGGQLGAGVGVTGDSAATEMVRGLTAATSALDSAACALLIRRSLTTRGVVWTWDELLRPVLRNVGRNWGTQRGRRGGGASTESRDRRRTGGNCGLYAPSSARPVLLTCGPGEDHSLPLYALAAALAERGVDRGCSVPAPGDRDLPPPRRIGPSAVVLWAQLPVRDAETAWASIPRQRPESLRVARDPVGPCRCRLAWLRRRPCQRSDHARASRVALPIVPPAKLVQPRPAGRIPRAALPTASRRCSSSSPRGWRIRRIVASQGGYWVCA